MAEDASILIFVKDLKRAGRSSNKPDYDHTIKHYETLFRSKKIDQSHITFMPLNQFFNEYTSLDQRRKLTYLYDKFICEESIAPRVNAFIGSKIMHDGRAAYPLDLGSNELIGDYDAVLRQVYYQFPFLEYNNRPSVRVGRSGMAPELVADNIIDLVRQLGTLHPGGSQNLQRIHLRAAGNATYGCLLYKNDGNLF